MKNIWISILAMLVLVSLACKTPQLQLSPEIKSQKGMAVKGRNGFLIGQVLRYGDYRTDPVRRGWTGSYQFPFFLKFFGAKEKLRFTQYGPMDKKAEVACVSRFRAVEAPLITDFFSLPLVYKNYFAGSIVLDSISWDFILHNPTGDFARLRESAGFAQQGNQRIEINAIRGLEGQPDWMKRLTVYGHEFSLNGKVIGAVSTINRGEVWIDESLDADIRTVVAALATGILLRRDVEEVVE